MWTATNWKDYELLDAASGERLERWGDYILIRPDPQIVWHGEKSLPEWRMADGIYRRSSAGGGSWVRSEMPGEWKVTYGDLAFILRPMGFKHTGLFPEQAANWDWFSPMIRTAASTGREVKILNLFAYTGGATLAAVKAGASVCHVDAARGMVAHAKENAAASGLSDAKIRYIVDDCRKFVEREYRRGNRYDGIIMDPPSYGRGPSGEVWKLEDSAEGLIGAAASILSDRPLFFLVSSYTAGISSLSMKYIVDLALKKRFGGSSEAGELTLPVRSTGLVLPCGSSVRWSADTR